MEELSWIIQRITIADIIDILIVAVLFFAVSLVFRGTQAAALLRGVLFIILSLVVIAALLQLRALGWLLTNAVTVIAVAIPVVFQPELRRFFEQVGRGGVFFWRQAPETVRVQIIQEVCRAAEKLAERRHGALIVLQRQSNLEEFIRTGVAIHSSVKAELLLTIFWPKTELHDGAVIIDNDGHIAAAAAVLPLTNKNNRHLPDPKMGTRHRAALGISEVGDAICVVVSEETGKISITNGGRMVSRLDAERLHNMLDAFYNTQGPENLPLRARIKDWVELTMARLQDARKVGSKP